VGRRFTVSQTGSLDGCQNRMASNQDHFDVLYEFEKEEGEKGYCKR
jgi:hypothetical protein